MQSELNIDKPSIGTKNLFEPLCMELNLYRGWLEVRRNRGSAGIDGVEIEDFEQNLAREMKQLKDELESWRYKPQPVRRVKIEKADGGERKLGIPCIRDRVIQATLKQILEPLLDPLFSDNSYGFRPGRNQEMAVKAAQKIVQEGKEYVVDIDLSDFFNRVNQDRLVSRLGKVIEDKRILKILGITLRSGVMEEGVYEGSETGLPQGSPLSPLMSNYVLDELDKEIERRGLQHCRFGDDCNIFVKSKKSAERIMERLTDYIEGKLKLVVNRVKSQVAKSCLVKFLGMTILEGIRVISKKTIRRAMKRVKELTPRGTHEKLEKTIERINRWYVGWSSYYSMTQYPSQLQAIEAHVRRRLRSRIVDQQKSERNLFNKLVKRGVSKTSAAVSFSNKRRWAMSHTRAVEKAYPNKWFIEEMGLKVRSNESREDWLPLKLWVKLA
jgi:RNA-directed DNA polymerase